MTTPVVLSSSTAFGTTSISIPTPTGTSTGDLLLVAVTVDDTTTSTSMSGFIELYQEISETFVTGSLYYRIADGTEGANLLVTLSSNNEVCAKAYRIFGYSGVPSVEFASFGNNTTQTPPQITPVGGSSDYLYLVFDHIDTTNAAINTYPNGYINTGDVASLRCRLGWGEKPTLATTTETPTAFILSATRRTVVSTIAIASVGGSGVTVSADIEISKPEFSVNSSVTFPQANSSIELVISSPVFSINSSITLPNPQTNTSLVIQKPEFSVSALVTLPNPDSDISTVIQKPVFNTLITVTTPNKVSDVFIDIGKPDFSVNTNVTLPQPASSIATNISKPLFSALISVTDPSFISNIDIDISGPVFSIEAVITQPLPVADINFNISKPIFSIMATVTGLDIIVGSNAKLTVNFESNKLTLKTQSNYLKV